jgi:anti-anti-sigma factor
MSLLSRPDCGADHALACGVASGGAGDMLRWTVQSRGPQVVVYLDGELDIATVPHLARQLEPLAETGSRLILSLAAVRFCDCSGLNLFVRLQHRASAAGGWMYLAEPTPAIRRIIALTGLRDILPIETGQAAGLPFEACNLASFRNGGFGCRVHGRQIPR